MTDAVHACVQCGGRFTPTNKRGPRPRFCSSECRNRSRTVVVTQGIRDARKTRSCSGCGTDITQTTHPLATRCADCQATHRSTRKRPKAKVKRLCEGCGKSIKGMARGKTSCADCGKPPRLCIDCGLVDLRGTNRWRCDDCKAAWDAGESERVRQWQADHPERTMLMRARTRAKERGLDCTITAEDVMIPATCPVYGVELARNLRQRHASAASPSIDRIDNSKGYVPGNVHIISALANSTKRDLGIAELAAGKATPKWQRWAIHYMAARESWPSRRIVRRRAA